MNLMEKIGAYVAGQEYNLTPDQVEYILEADEDISKSALDDSQKKELLLNVIRSLDTGSANAMLAHKRRATRKALQKEVEEKEASTGERSAEAMKAILLTSILAGNLGGSAYYLLNQHARKEKAENEALKRRIDLYRDVTRNIRQELSPAVAGA